ncbi:MAG: hypothetical protein WCK34_00740 [Bacteroidota bacterium]
METKFVVFDGHEFPMYLNFGVLDEKSIRLDGDTTIAEYLLDLTSDIVHRVKWSTRSCELETWLEGNRESSTRYFNCDLKGILRNEYLVNDGFYRSRIFLKITGAVKRLENILVDVEEPVKSEWNMNFYPAGKLFTFRVPYGPEITEIKTFMEQNVGSAWLGAMTFQDGFMLSYSKNSGLVEESLAFAEFPVPLAHIVRAAIIIGKSGLLPSGGHQKIVLQESYKASLTEMIGYMSKESSCAMFFREVSDERKNVVRKEFMDAANHIQSR